MPPWRCLPSPGPTWLLTLEAVDPRVARSAGVGELPWQGACRGCRGCPARALPGRPASPVCTLWLWSLMLPCLSRAFGFSPASLLCPIMFGHGGSTARAQVKGSKGEPLLLYTDRSPRAWAIQKRNTLLGQAQNGARAVGADFTAATVSSTALPHDPRLMRDVGVVRGAVHARLRYIVMNGKEAARAFPIKRRNHRHAAHLPPVPSPIFELSLPSSSSGSCLCSPPPRPHYP